MDTIELDLDMPVTVRHYNGQEAAGIIVELPNASGYYGVKLHGIRLGDEWGWGPVWYFQADRLSVLIPIRQIESRCTGDDPCDIHSPCPAHAEFAARALRESIASTGCTTPYRQVTREQLLRKDQLKLWPQLHPDAPLVPSGLQPRPGVEYGCGEANCADCYEMLPVEPNITKAEASILFPDIPFDELVEGHKYGC